MGREAKARARQASAAVPDPRDEERIRAEVEACMRDPAFRKSEGRTQKQQLGIAWRRVAELRCALEAIERRCGGGGELVRTEDVLPTIRGALKNPTIAGTIPFEIGPRPIGGDFAPDKPTRPDSPEAKGRAR